MAEDVIANRTILDLISEVKSGNAEARKAEMAAIDTEKKGIATDKMNLGKLGAEIRRQGGVAEENRDYLKAQQEVEKRGLQVKEMELQLRKKSTPFFSEARKNIKTELKENKRAQRDTTFLGKIANAAMTLPRVMKDIATTDLKLTKGSASQDEEKAKDEKSHLSKMFSGLSKGFEKGFSILGKGLEKFKSVAGTGFKALLTAAGIGLLIKFLQSDAWKKIRVWVKENGETVLNGIVKLLELLYDKVLKPVLDFFLPKFKKFFDDLLVFLDNPSWSNLGTLVGDNKIALAGMVALLAPGIFLKGLKVAILGLKTAVGLITVAMNTTIATAFTGLGTAIAGIGTSIAAVLVPVLVVAAIVSALIGLFVGLKNAVEIISKDVEDGNLTWGTIGRALFGLFEGLATVPNMIAEMFIPEDFRESWHNSMADFIDDSLAFVDDLGATVTEWFQSILSPFKRALAAFDAESNPVSGMVAAGKALFSGGEEGGEEGGEAPKNPEPVDPIDAAVAAGMAPAEARKQAQATIDKRQVSIDKVFAKEGEVGLDRVIANLKRELEGEGADKKTLSAAIKQYEAKKSELEAARAGGGGNVTNIAQNNSTNMNSSTTRAENISVLDPETVQVQAANI